MTSEEVTADTSVTNGEFLSEPSEEVSTEPWVMFGGYIYKSLEWNEMVETFVVGQVMMASNFSLSDNTKFGEGRIISIITYSILFHWIVHQLHLTLLADGGMLMKKNRNRMSLLLIHLSVADLLVSLHL